MPIYVNINGAYKKVISPSEKINGVWKTANSTKVNINGAWRECSTIKYVRIYSDNDIYKEITVPIDGTATFEHLTFKYDAASAPDWYGSSIYINNVSIGDKTGNNILSFTVDIKKGDIIKFRGYDNTSTDPTGQTHGVRTTIYCTYPTLA